MTRKDEPISPFSWTTGEILEAISGELLCGSKEQQFSGVSIDSRNMSAGDLFIAIKGETHDGHSYVNDVISRGIRGLVISKEKADDLFCKKWEKNGLTGIAVADTTIALGDLAAFTRRRTNVSIIAITGSNGKTTTRGMTADVLSQRFGILTAKKNFNNLIGLPLTLLELSQSHQWAILELGMNQPGEIGRLGDICLPDIGVITNIGPVHLQGFDSIEGVASTKAELLETIKPEGTVVLNADDRRLLSLSHNTKKNVLLYGLSKDAAIRAVSIREKKPGTVFTLVLPAESINVELGFPGSFMVSNALAAAAIGWKLGLNADEIKNGLETFRPAKGRMNILSTRKNIHIIDDTYNANPVSMKAVIRTLRSLRGSNRSILVAGDMLELGDYAVSMHRMIGALAARSNMARLYLTGDYAGAVASGAEDEDMDAGDIFTGTRKEVFKDLTGRLQSGDWVLVKGSRATEMEKIVEWLKDWADA
jgi:UDP-N-acetylmuramoyl-tripeptide--D-alanyl-D-alanine ligase